MEAPGLCLNSAIIEALSILAECHSLRALSLLRREHHLKNWDVDGPLLSFREQFHETMTLRGVGTLGQWPLYRGGCLSSPSPSPQPRPVHAFVWSCLLSGVGYAFTAAEWHLLCRFHDRFIIDGSSSSLEEDVGVPK